MGKRGSLRANSQQVTVQISSRRLAIKSLTNDYDIRKAEALRALELVACVLLPLSMTMLWIEPRKFLPLYFLIYTLPALACWQQKAFRFPALLLVSPARRQGLLCPVRLPRAVATIAQLALLHWLPQHCEEPIRYYIGGKMSLHDKMTAFPTDALVLGQVPMLNRASAEMACPARNRFPAEAKFWFFCAQYVVAGVSMIWLALVTLDTWGGLPQFATSDPEAVEDLSQRIAATETKDEIAEINDPVVVSPERAIQCLPPGGIYFTVGMAVCDMLTDLNNVYSCVMAAQLQFALVLVAIVSTSCTVEALASTPWTLSTHIAASVQRGLSTDALRHALDYEGCFESPLSLCLTAYAFAFNVRGGGLPALVSSLMSMAISTYNTASYMCWNIDLGLHDAEMGEHISKKDWHVRRRTQIGVL